LLRDQLRAAARRHALRAARPALALRPQQRPGAARALTRAARGGPAPAEARPLTRAARGRRPLADRAARSHRFRRARAAPDGISSPAAPLSRPLRRGAATRPSLDERLQSDITLTSRSSGMIREKSATGISGVFVLIAALVGL